MGIRRVSGNLSLEQLTATLGVEETVGRFRLLGLAKGEQGEEEPFNFATFVRTPRGQTPGELVLVALSDASAIGATILEQQGQGRSFLFFAEAFVESQETMLAAFRGS